MIIQSENKIAKWNDVDDDPDEMICLCSIRAVQCKWTDRRFGGGSRENIGGGGGNWEQRWHR